MTAGLSSGDASLAARYGRVAVLMGGWSAEREISLISGRAVVESLSRSGIEAIPVDVDRATVPRLATGGFDRVFVILHGRGGEDGVLQGLLEALDLPYTGSGVLGSALGMDKLRTKQIWRAEGIPTPPHRILSRGSDLHAIGQALGFPLMVKPVHEGSSIGIRRVTNTAELETAWREAAQYDREVMAERCVEGPEYTAAVLADRTLPLIRLETSRVFYDYQAKYEDDDTRYLCPCGLSIERESSIQALAKRAFDAVGAEGWGRVDLMSDKAGEPWFIEVNTVPGMTGHSLVPMAARAAGLDFDRLVLEILDTAERRLPMAGEPASDAKS